jgi:hypothetical protein
MRKITAILVLAVLLFNLFGYRLLVSYLVTSSNQSLETALDNHEYNDDELISIKKAVNMPYYNNTKDFTRAYGEVEMNGTYYTYVKSRIFNDSIEMLCIPNNSKQQLLSAKDQFNQAVFDLQKDNTKKNGQHKTITFTNLLSEYVATTGWQLDGCCLPSAAKTYAVYHVQAGLQYKATAEQPPDPSC